MLKSLILLHFFIASLFTNLEAQIHLQANQAYFASKSHLISENNLLYAMSCHYLEIIDASVPQQLKTLSQLSTDACPKAIQLLDNTLYIAKNAGFIDIVDVSNAQSPRFIQQFYIGFDYNLVNIHIYNNYLYVVTVGRGLLIFSLDDPNNPKLVNQWDQLGYIDKIVLQGEHLYIHARSNGKAFEPSGSLWVLDINEPEKKQLLATKIFLFDHYLEGFFSVLDNYLYVGTFDPEKKTSHFYILNVDNPIAPDITAYSLNDEQQTAFIPSVSFKIATDKNQLFISSTNNAFYRLDVSNPLAPTLSTLNNVKDQINNGIVLYANSLSANNGYVYLNINNQGLEVRSAQQWDLQTRRQNISDGQYIMARNKRHYLLDNNILHLLNSADNLSIIDSLELFTEDTILEWTYNKDSLFLSSINNKLYIIDISDPNKLHLRASLDFFETRYSTKYASYATADRLYVLATLLTGTTDPSTANYLRIFDITNPQNPVLLNEIIVTNIRSLLTVKSGYVYLNTTVADTIKILDTNNPQQLTESLHQIPVHNDVNILIGDYWYIAAPEGRVHILDVSQANLPQFKGTWAVSGAIKNMRWKNNILHIFTDKGLTLWDLSQATIASYLGGLTIDIKNTNFSSFSVAEAESNIYFSVRFQGIMAFKVENKTDTQLFNIENLENGACQLLLGATLLNTLDQGQANGDLALNWYESGRATTNGGDAVLAGYFYADAKQVSWGNEANPEIYAKLWFARNGKMSLNFFHVGVFDAYLDSFYNNKLPIITGGVTSDMNRLSIQRRQQRYVRFDYYNWRDCGTDLENQDIKNERELALAQFIARRATIEPIVLNIDIETTDITGACDISLGAKMLDTLDDGRYYGDINLHWHEVKRGVSSGGDNIIAGYLYADPADVSWGNAGNPEAWVKIWFARDGILNINFFHVGVFDIVLTSRYQQQDPQINQGGDMLSVKNPVDTKLPANYKRYQRHDYSNWRLCQ